MDVFQSYDHKCTAIFQNHKVYVSVHNRSKLWVNHTHLQKSNKILNSFNMLYFSFLQSLVRLCWQIYGGITVLYYCDLNIVGIGID